MDAAMSKPARQNNIHKRVVSAIGSASGRGTASAVGTTILSAVGRAGIANRPATVKPKVGDWKQRRVKLIGHALWPPDGKWPAHLTKPDIIRTVGNAYQKKYKATVSRNTILRALGLQTT